MSAPRSNKSPLKAARDTRLAPRTTKLHRAIQGELKLMLCASVMLGANTLVRAQVETCGEPPTMAESAAATLL